MGGELTVRLRGKRKRGWIRGAKLDQLAEASPLAPHQCPGCKATIQPKEIGVVVAG